MGKPMRQYIADVSTLEGVRVNEYYKTMRDNHEPYTHAVVGIYSDSPQRGCVLGWYQNEFAAHQATKNWRDAPGYAKVAVIPVDNYPLGAR